MQRIIPLILICFLAAGYGCANKAQQGAGVGALAGATIGALTFKDKMLGAAVGAGVGTLMGYIVGNEWDKADEAKVQAALEKTDPARQAIGQTRIREKVIRPHPIIPTWQTTRSIATSSLKKTRMATLSWQRHGVTTKVSGT